jgi:hypothetical protein
VCDILWKVRRETLAVVVLLQGVSNATIRKKARAHDANFHVRRVYYVSADKWVSLAQMR